MGKVYGCSNENNSGSGGLTVDSNGFVTATANNIINTLVSRDKRGVIYVNGNYGDGYAVPSGELEKFTKVPLNLGSNITSGTISNSDATYLKHTVNKCLSLDNEIYHLITRDVSSSTYGSYVFKNVNGNIEKTISINSDNTWELTTVDKTLYSHNVYITFTTDVGGNGNVLLNIINNESTAFIVATLLQYLIDEDLLNADIQASGRYILSGGEGGAVTSFYSADGTILSISTIFSDGMVSANVNATAITDKVVKIN